MAAKLPLLYTELAPWFHLLTAPEDYAEFLFRTSGLLLHEPAAAGRAHGQPPR